MIQKIQISIFALFSSLLVAYPSSSISTTEAKQANYQNNFAGRWSQDCDDFEGIKINGAGSAIFTINSNQINVNAHVVVTNSDTIDIYFDSSSDLGRGGMTLDWDNFSLSKPIANAEIKSVDYMDVTWLGFFNDALKTYQWKNQPDFYKNGKKSRFHRCNN